MTPSQTETANFVLMHLRSNNGIANFNEFGSLYISRYGYQREQELYTVLRILTDDERLIAQESNGFYRLTAKGADMADKGYGKYKRRLSLAEQFSVAKEAIALVASIVAIISAVVSWLTQCSHPQ